MVTLQTNERVHDLTHEAQVTIAVEIWLQRVFHLSIVTVVISLLTLATSLLRKIVKTESDDTPNPELLAEADAPKTGGWPSRRKLGFMILWILLGLSIAGFAPAYVVKLLRDHWYFDAAAQRPEASNARPRWVSLHALVGAAWWGVMLHQTITAYQGVRRSERLQARQSSHRIVGKIGTFVSALCCLTGVYLLFFSAGSRLLEKMAVSLTGIYAGANVVLGVAHVKRGNIQAHKQSMAWAITWTSATGIVRGMNYVVYMVASTHGPRTCLNLLTSRSPRYCEIVSLLMSTEIGMGPIPLCAAGLLPWVLGCILWRLWGFGHWEIVAGNSLGFMLINFWGSIGSNVIAANVIQGDDWRMCTMCQ
jgi:uncharacterized membrane protein YozB (DUF420 family)